MAKAKGKRPNQSRCRTGRGRFRPGVSGNPSGRPPGIEDRRVQLRSLFEPHKEQLIRKAVRLALNGDTAALRLCIERLIPAYRPTNEPIEANIPAGTLSQQAQSIFREAVDGRLSSDDAAKLSELLLSRLKIIEVEEIEKRIAALEAQAVKMAGKKI